MASEAQIRANRENAKKAGRPVGSVSEYTRVGVMMKEKLAERVEREYGEMLDAIISRCKSGDVAAWKDILDRLAGKATDHVDISTNGESLNDLKLIPTSELLKFTKGGSRGNS